MSPRRSSRLTQKPRLDYSRMVKQAPASASRISVSTSDAVVAKRRICPNFIDSLLIINIGLMCVFALSSYDIIHSRYLLDSISMSRPYML